MTSHLVAKGHTVVGLDTDFFGACDFLGHPDPVPQLTVDLRDVTASDLEGFDAVLHLAPLSNDPLSDLDPRLTYDINLHASVRPGGTAIIAAFAQDGPERCSGLACVRYSPDVLQRELGSAFRLEESIPESHRTPVDTVQKFEYHRFTRAA